MGYHPASLAVDLAHQRGKILPLPGRGQDSFPWALGSTKPHGGSSRADSGQTRTLCLCQSGCMGVMSPLFSAAPSAPLGRAQLCALSWAWLRMDKELAAFWSKLFQSHKSKVGPGCMFEKERHVHTQKKIQARLSHL